LFYKPGEIKNVTLPAEEPLHAECAHFLECIRTGTTPHADANAGVAVVQILEAACASIENRSTRISLL
jgi:UDP-2-acetamido-3-amino-2,3-dideoxy-glucuronate N-acetyltransferase